MRPSLSGGGSWSRSWCSVGARRGTHPGPGQRAGPSTAPPNPSWGCRRRLPAASSGMVPRARLRPALLSAGTQSCGTGSLGGPLHPSSCTRSHIPWNRGSGLPAVGLGGQFSPEGVYEIAEQGPAWRAPGSEGAWGAGVPGWCPRCTWRSQLLTPAPHLGSRAGPRAQAASPQSSVPLPAPGRSLLPWPRTPPPPPWVQGHRDFPQFTKTRSGAPTSYRAWHVSVPAASVARSRVSTSPGWTPRRGRSHRGARVTLATG